MKYSIEKQIPDLIKLRFQVSSLQFPSELTGDYFDFHALLILTS